MSYCHQMSSGDITLKKHISIELIFAVKSLDFEFRNGNEFSIETIFICAVSNKPND